MLYIHIIICTYCSSHGNWNESNVLTKNKMSVTMDKPITSNDKTGLETCLRTAMWKSNTFTFKIFIFIGCNITTGWMVLDISRQCNVTHFQGSWAFQPLKRTPLYLKIPWSSNKRSQKTAPLKTGSSTYAPSEFTICDFNNADDWNTVVIQNTTK